MPGRNCPYRRPEVASREAGSDAVRRRSAVPVPVRRREKGRAQPRGGAAMLRHRNAAAARLRSAWTGLGAAWGEAGPQSRRYRARPQVREGAGGRGYANEEGVVGAEGAGPVGLCGAEMGRLLWGRIGGLWGSPISYGAIPALYGAAPHPMGQPHILWGSFSPLWGSPTSFRTAPHPMGQFQPYVGQPYILWGNSSPLWGSPMSYRAIPALYGAAPLPIEQPHI